LNELQDFVIILPAAFGKEQVVRRAKANDVDVTVNPKRVKEQLIQLNKSEMIIQNSYNMTAYFTSKALLACRMPAPFIELERSTTKINSALCSTCLNFGRMLSIIAELPLDDSCNSENY